MAKTKKKRPLIVKLLEEQGPDHGEGFTEFRMKQLLNGDQFGDFKKWMRGQAIRVEGSMAIYYIDDVMRWAWGLERWRAEMSTTKSHG